MIRATLLAIAALPAALLLGASQADAARPLLAEFLARAPAKQPIMSPLALEACLRTARELDATGIAIDYQIAAIERETAEAMFLENRINAEFPVLNGYDEAALVAFQKRVIRHEELAKKLKAEFPVYRQKKKSTTPRLPPSTATAHRASPPPTSARPRPSSGSSDGREPDRIPQDPRARLVRTLARRHLRGARGA